MIQVKLSPEREAAIENAAAATGLDISEYIWESVQARLTARVGAHDSGDARTREQRKAAYREFIQQQTSHNPQVDDSRESIYD